MNDDQKIRIDGRADIESLDLERINLAAERLNLEVLDVLAYQVSFEDID